MKSRLLPLLAILLIPFSCPASGYRYEIRDGGFWIDNGQSYFNRPLFGTHEPTMLLSGDRPAFTYISPPDIGKIGTLYIGIDTARGGKWLDRFSQVSSLYQPGLTRHTLEDPAITSGTLEVTAVPLSSREGFALRLRWVKPPEEEVRLVVAFGGASGYGGNYDLQVEKLKLSSDDAARNVLHIWGKRFSLTSPALKGREIWGACDLPGQWEAKDAGEVLPGPSAARRASPSKSPLAVFGGAWPPAQGPVHLLFTMAGAQALEEISAQPSQTFDQSVQFYRSLARRVEVKTPDPYFDLAVQAMAIADDGMWQPPSFVHGAMSWMQHYLGWRIWYGADAYGWHDRVLSSILAFAALQIRSGDSRGAIPEMLEAPDSVFYNMDEVYLDHIYYHQLWTGDRSLLASLFPMIQGLLSWEKRRLDPDDNALFENCLNTWISDSHWYSGGDCTQASAYMFRGNQLAAEAAEAAGADPAPYRQQAERIRTAMNGKLWLASAGHFAEFVDRLGLGRIHTEPELPTIYHPIDFGLTDPFQAYQMLRFTETSLRNETGIPRGGRLVWSSNWAPNYNQHYTHSTYDLVFAENLNLAIAYYRAGQVDKAYDLVKGVYASMYQGGIPGGLSCHAYSNGQQRANEEFADAISMFARTAVEGVFGILPEMQHGIVTISPGFPRDWKEASISTPDLSYRFHKTETEISLQVETARPLRIRYRLPLFDASVAEAALDGSRVEARTLPGIGSSFVDFTAALATRGQFMVKLKPRPAALRAEPVVAVGERLTIETKSAPLGEFKDPQTILGEARSTDHSLTGIVGKNLGPHTLFVLVGGAGDSRWEPVNLEVRPPFEIVNPQLDPASAECRFTLRNNRPLGVKLTAKALWTGKATELQLDLPARAEAHLTAQGNPSALLLGKNRLEVSGLPGGTTLQTEAGYWPPAPPAAAAQMVWKLVRLDPFYNDRLAAILSHPFWTSGTDYPYPVCRDYMLEHLVGDRSRRPNDDRLRSRVNAQGVLATEVGIPFAQRAEGKNLVALSRWKDFPAHLAVPINEKARKIYLLLSGVTFPMQSQIANLHIAVNYVDGGKTELDLVNPETFDSSWAGFFGGNYHSTSNGMEVIGAGETDMMGSHMPAARPQTILGQQGAPEPLDYSQWTAASHADIVDLDCDPSRPVQTLEITVLSNEIIAALHGVTLLK
jgi:hypothetical protein